MKHIKYLRESIDKSTLTDEINSYLAYLKDDGFELNITKTFDESYSLIIVKEGSNYFDPDEILDYLIPFLEVFSEKYTFKIHISVQNWDDDDNHLYGGGSNLPNLFILTYNEFKNFDFDFKSSKSLKSLSIHDIKEIIPTKNPLKKFGNFIKKQFNK